MTQSDPAREHLIETYRKKADHYDFAARFAPVPGYPQHAQRVRAVQALGLRPGATVVEVACGTGLNFSLLEEAVGPRGHIVGVDLTDAMLTKAHERMAANAWRNVELVHADAADYHFPAGVDAILSTFALTQVPECAEVVARGAAALAGGGRWVVLDVKIPANLPRWLLRSAAAVIGPFASIDEWMSRRPWDAIRGAMQENLTEVSWTELVFGTAFLASGSRAPHSGG